MGNAFRMHVLGADYGDCLWVDYGDVNAPHRILVDAGTPATFSRLKPCLDQVRGATPSHELLLITHIDEDHIGGGLNVLYDPKLAGQFKNVWFNGRRHLLEAAEEEDFGAVQGEKLTAAILARNVAWNAHFGGRGVVRDKNGKPVTVDLPGGAKVTVLTPSATQLKKLLPVWDKAVRAVGLDPENPKIVVPTVEDEESFGTIDVTKLAGAVTKEDTAEANGSSISTLIEFEGKKLLLGADAHPSVLLEGIKQITGGKRLEVDVFKLPHHGSKANVTEALLDAVDAKVIVFSTNGVKFRHPDREAVARVIRRYGKGAKLVFNYDTQFTSIWRDAGIQGEWGYDVEYGVGDAGISVILA